MDKNNILVEVSARHVHLTAAEVETLFGDGVVLEPRNSLEQPGLFAAKQRVDVIGPKGTLRGLTILGPCRNYTQVELSMTDARVLGVEAVFRESGDLDGTPGCTIVGPAGSIQLDKGVIVPQRHIHVNSKDAEDWGIQDKDVVSIQLDEQSRSLVFNDVLARVNPKVMTFVHIDTDEGNAANVNRRTYGRLVDVKKGDR